LHDLPRRPPAPAPRRNRPFRSLFSRAPACYKTILLRNTKEPDVYYTLSEWESEAHLDRYRYSAFFKETWAFTKSLFAEKAQAFSGLPVVM